MRALSDSQASAEQQTLQLESIFRPIFRRKNVVIVTFAVFLVAATLVALWAPKTYTTQVRLIAGNSAGSATTSAPSNTDLPILNALLAAANQQSADTYATLLTELPVAQRVIGNLDLHTTARGLLGHVVVKPVTNTSIISLSVEWNSASMSAAIANEFAKVFIQRQRDFIATAAGVDIDFISKQLPPALHRMQAADAALASYSQRNQIADLTSQTQAVVTAVSANEAKLAQSQLERQQFQAQLRSVSAQIGSYAPSSTGSSSLVQNPIVAQLQTQLAQVELQLQAALRQYTENYPAVIALRTQRDDLRNKIAQTPKTVVSTVNTIANPVHQELASIIPTLQSQIAAGDAQISELERQKSSLRSSLAKLPDQAVILADLQRKTKSAQDVYNALQKKYSDALIVETTVPSSITTTQNATAADALVKPNRLLTVIVGAMLGLIVAIASAFIVDMFDNTVKTEHQLAERLALPILGAIPIAGKHGGNTKLNVRLQNMTIEAFLQFVTSLNYSSDRPLKSLTFSSPMPGDGKSTIALNAAITMAELEPQVLIIDADLRKPTLHRRLNLPNIAGLSDVLVGRRSLDDVLQKTRHPGLDFISSGVRAPNPVKLLRSERMDSLLGELSSRYSYVLIDTPAVNVVVDGVVLAAKTDGSVLIVSANHTDMPAIVKATKLFHQFGVTSLLGVVLNRAAPQQNHDYADYLDAPPINLALNS